MPPVETCLLEDTQSCANRNLVGGMARDSDSPRFLSVTVVAMAAGRADMPPAIAFHHLDEIANLHELEAVGEGEQGDVARLLDGERKATLVAGADAGEAARDDLAALGDEALEQADVAVADGVDLFGAELADLFAAEELASARAAAGTACGTGTAAPPGPPAGRGPRGVKVEGAEAAGADCCSGALLVSSAMVDPFRGVMRARSALQTRWGVSGCLPRQREARVGRCDAGDALVCAGVC